MTVRTGEKTSHKLHARVQDALKLLTPNFNYNSRTAPLTPKVAFYICIQQI